jgi:putative flippase GtrA
VREQAGTPRRQDDGWGAQLARFTLVGGSSNAVYLLAFLALAEFGTFLANTVGVAASTVLANELHRRRTFRAADRVHWFTAQWEGGATALAGLVLSSATLALMHRVLPAAAAGLEAATLIAVSAAVGGLRFLALRRGVFRTT